MESLNTRLGKIEERQKNLEKNFQSARRKNGFSQTLTDEQKELFIFMLEYVEKKAASTDNKRK